MIKTWKLDPIGRAEDERICGILKEAGWDRSRFWLNGNNGLQPDGSYGGEDDRGVGRRKRPTDGQEGPLAQRTTTKDDESGAGNKHGPEKEVELLPSKPLPRNQRKLGPRGRI